MNYYEPLDPLSFSEEETREVRPRNAARYNQCMSAAGGTLPNDHVSHESYRRWP
jgi:hypothetical protein